MNHRFAIQLWRSPASYCLAVTLVGILFLTGTTGCSMAGVYPGASTPGASATSPTAMGTATVLAEITVELATATQAEMTQEITRTATKTGRPSPTSAPPTLTATPTITDTPTRAPTATTTATTIARASDVSPLTGQKVDDEAVLQRLPLFVRIGNDPQIRPQSGLGSADIVYEDIMDGWWITRLTAVFLGEALEAVGPVRSARLVNLQMVPQYQGALVHSGASDPIRWRLSKSDIVDLDEFFHRSPYFYREGADWRGRLFVNMEDLREYLEEEGLEREVILEGFLFDADGDPPPTGRPATELTIPYPKNSVVRFEYDPVSGLYQRFVQGQAHLDALTNEQLSAANVIVQYCAHEKTDIVEDSQGTTSINIVLVGEGRVLIFRDGVVLEGRWVASDPNQMTRFVDDEGQPIPLKPGQTWVELVPQDYEIATLPAGLVGGSMTTTATLTTTVQETGGTDVKSTADGEYYLSEELSATEAITDPSGLQGQ